MSQKSFPFLKKLLEGNATVLGDFGCILHIYQNHFHFLDSKKVILEKKEYSQSFLLNIFCLE